ncbi:hypothetical protein B0H17DRAFT_1332936 [Mycena rosella]|uniref:Pentatricopeptide repeat-containing protein n=1 Tax=Mycena rosella TaxID=1033263 RepID=A0AAD7D9B6_MYCRO|nr:hypothetical protein B0H17DRAFT_1332936 [Mycena rosella]
MVEPAATIVFNTLLQGRSTLGHPSSIYSVSRVVSRSLTPGFFNPQPRRVKGKERMPDHTRPDVLSAYSARCKEWSCRMRVSIWCADPKTADEAEIRRAPRRARKTSALPRGRGLALPVLHRGQTRHASHTSERPFPDSDPPSSNADTSALDPPTEASANGSLESSDAPVEDVEVLPEIPAPSEPPLDDISETDSPPTAETESAPPAPVPDPPPPRHVDSSVLQADVRYLQSLIAEPQDRFQLEKTWHAYEVVQTHGGLSFLSVEELLTLADKLLDFVELRNQTDELEELHKWGERVRRMLEELGTLLVPAQNGTRHSLRARALALEGELQKSLDIIHSQRSDYELFHTTLRVYESVLVSTWRHFDRIRALEFLILEWKVIGSYLLTETSRVHAGSGLVASAGASLRETSFAIVSGISLPALVLADKEGDWDEKSRKHLGELMIEAFFRAKLPMESVDILREMTRQELKPALHLPLHLVRALARENLYDDAHTIFSTLAHAGTTHEYLFTGLYLHAHEGQDQEAEEYFNRITDAGWQNSKDVLQLMYAYAVQGQTQKTLEIFQEFFPEDAYGVPTNSPLIEHFTVGIFAHAQRGDFGETGLWLNLLSKAGMQPDAYVFTTILKSLALQGNLDDIASVLDQMRAAGCPPNLVTYTTVMTLLAHRKDPASTEAIYVRALSDGIVPDSMMIATLMNAHIEAGSWKGVIRAFDFVASSPSAKLTIGIYNLLLKAYIQIGAPFRIVSRIFNQLERLRIRPDGYTFALLIQSACDARQMDTAAKIFLEMERLAEHWGSSRHITTWALTIIMSGFLRRGDHDEAMTVYQDMVTRGLKPNAVTYGVIIGSYGRAGTAESFELAEKFIKELTAQDPEARTWDTPPHGRLSARDHLYLPLLQAYASRHQIEELERVFGQMLDDGGEPTLSILNTMLDAYARVGDVANVLAVWRQIFTLGIKYSTIPLFEADSTGQRAATMHSFIANVWKTFQAHGLSFSADNWNELALALAYAGELERCFEVLEKVLLPYHRRSNRLRQERDPNPDSPLSLDVAPANVRPLETPLVGKARSAATKWTRFHRRAVDQFEDPQYADDLAYHLHVLHRISPMWNTWLPRHDLLRKLFDALLRLRAGYPVDAEERDADEIARDPEELSARRADAETRLRAIYEAYPDAVRSVDRFELRERRRLGRWFTKVYTWAANR